jgi:hypothetical protein
MLLAEHFFGWLEVSSLLGELLTASAALQSSVKWIKVLSTQDHDKELADFAVDANIFVSTFRYPISQSTPHISISALPFSPTSSIVSMQFRSKYPFVLSVDVGKLTEWPVTADRTIEGIRLCACETQRRVRRLVGHWKATQILWYL